MKKSSKITYLLLAFGLGLSLVSCKDKTSPEESPESLEVISPEIKYVKEERETFKNSSKKRDFEEIYGFGKYSDAIKINDSLGNFVATDFGPYLLGIRLDISDIAKGAISAYVTYFDKEDEKLEKPKDIEFGPIWVDDPKLISNITFDKLKSDSGDMLLVSLSVISDNDQYSSYFIYNKYMSLVDYMSFTNSTANTSVEVTRGNKVSYPDENLGGEGSVADASKKRFDMEKRYLKDLEETYHIDYEEVFQTIDGEKTPVANFPQDKARVYKMLTVESITNLDKYPSDKGYFKIY